MYCYSHWTPSLRMATCTEEGCDEPAAVRLHVPWADNRLVCAPHARVLVQQEGVVAEPILDDDLWP